MKVSAAVLGLSLVVVSPAVGEETVEDLQARINRLWEEHPSMVMHIDDQKRGHRAEGEVVNVQKGTVRRLKQGDRVLTRFDLEETETVTTYDGGAAQTSQNKLVRIDDGEALIVYIEGSPQIVRRPDGGVEDPRLVLDRFKKHYQMRVLIDRDPESGAPQYVVDGTVQRRHSESKAGVSLKFREDGVLLELRRYSPIGELAQTTTYTDIRFDAAIDPKEFVLTPPEGVTVRELKRSDTGKASGSDE